MLRADRSTLPADDIVLATGYTTDTYIRTLYVETIASKLGKVWALNKEGELRNIFSQETLSRAASSLNIFHC